MFYTHCKCDPSLSTKKVQLKNSFTLFSDYLTSAEEKRGVSNGPIYMGACQTSRGASLVMQVKLHSQWAWACWLGGWPGAATQTVFPRRWSLARQQWLCPRLNPALPGRARGPGTVVLWRGAGSGAGRGSCEECSSEAPVGSDLPSEKGCGGGAEDETLSVAHFLSWARQAKGRETWGG